MSDVVDATVSEVPEGRFEGDLDAVLSYDPWARKPYIVTAWIWETDPLARWMPTVRGAYGMYGDLDHEKSFKRLNKAVAYHYAIKARAETMRLRRVVVDKVESRREVLL